MQDLRASRRGICLLACSLLMVSVAAGCGNSTGNNIVLDPQGFSGQVAAITDSPVTLFEARRDAVAANVVGSGSRDINWDGAAVTVLIPANTSAAFPPELFFSGGGLRQIFFGGGSGEIPIVSEDSFATIDTGTGFVANPSTLSAANDLDPFTGTVNITSAASNTLTVNFTLQGATTTAGLVHGFGVIFQDVEIGAKSGLRFFDAAGQEIHQIFAQPLATGADQFVGAIFANPVVAHVIIDMGDNDQFGTDNENIAGGVDFVAVDDLRFFLSDTVMPVTEFRSQVTDITDGIVARFEVARRPLAQGQDQNIDWDGAAVTVLTNGGTATITSDIFLVGAGNRQLIIAGPNEDIRVSENRFATLDAIPTDNPSEPGSSATAGADFAALTSNVNFTVMGGEVATQSFFLADQTTPALIHGFAVIFTDVEVANQSGLRFLDANGQVIRTVFAQVQASGTHQIVGALFPSAQVAQVQVLLGDANSTSVADSGNADFGTGPAGVGVGGVEDIATGKDHVVVDNFLFFKSTVPAN